MGAFLFAPLCQWLLSIYDWKSTLIILAGLILNCSVYGALMRPLNIEVTNENEDEKVVTNTEPGVQSNTNLHKLHVENVLPKVTNSNDNLKFFYQRINNKRRNDKKRTKSECVQPALEDILSADPLLATRIRTASRTSSRSIILPPMTKNDVFYSGSTLNLTKYKNSLTSNQMLCSKQIFSNNNIKYNELSDKNSEENSSWWNELFDFSLLKKTEMILLLVSNLFGMAGYYIPFVYITQFVTRNIKGKHYSCIDLIVT